MQKLVIHGGIAKFEGTHLKRADYARELRRIVADAAGVLAEQGARAAVLQAVRWLEDEPLFNAGTGSRIQADGEIRMSAALMDGNNQVFSGVVNVQYVQHPIDIAEKLSNERHKVLAGAEATRYARAAGFMSHNPYTAHRLREYQERWAGQTGTVGAVALDDSGALYAATSTGGVGGERPGRVSDSATVAGTYATALVGVSCTGIGEEIVNHALAARVAVRVEDGATLAAAVEQSLAEARARGCLLGLIALAVDGSLVFGQTEGTVLYASAEHGQIRTFAE